jgi:hypothetical protein
MRVLVCGGRTFRDRAMVFAALDCLHGATPIGCIIEGGAKGADTFAREWARSRSVAVKTFEVTKAEWDRLGLAAGPIRNARMLSDGEPDLCLAFPGNRGTADMVRRCQAAGVEVRRILAAVASGGES